jgi:hypothetical protein
MNLNPLSERRVQRSTQILTALTLQLEHIFHKEGLRNFALGDENGMVITSAGDSREAEVLAAFAPVFSRSGDREDRRQILSRVANLLPDITPETLHVQRFAADGEPLYLVLVGQPDAYHRVGLFRAITGVRRILDRPVAA